MRRSTALIIFMLASVVVPRAQGAEPDQARRKLQLLLGAHHQLPSKAVFERATPNAKAMLVEIAENDRVFSHYRHRALVALAHWPGDDVLTLYRSILSRRSTTEPTRHRLIALLGRTFGDRAVGTLSGYLKSSNVRIRLSAATALGRIGSDRARIGLEAAVDSERAPAVKRVIRKVLDRNGR